jgi:sec-independent protein translocase protein TatB
MFDVGFSELMVIAVVALVVIGPERLPAVARTLGHLFGRLQRYVNDVKADISREIELDELKKFKNQFEDAAQSVESSVRSDVEGAEATFNSVSADLNPVEPGLPEAPAVSPPPGVPDVETTSLAAEGGAPVPAAPAAARATVEHKTAA